MKASEAIPIDWINKQARGRIKAAFKVEDPGVQALILLRVECILDLVETYLLEQLPGGAHAENTDLEAAGR